MDWFNIGSAAIGAIGGLLGNKQSGTASASLDKSNRNWQTANYERNMRDTLGTPAYDWVKTGAGGIDQIGRDRDYAYSGHAQRQAFDIAQDEYGLTPQEIAGSPVAGGTNQSGGAATLGNNQSQANAVMAQAMDRSADRANARQIESMRNKTQLMTAAMQSGVNLLGQQTQKRGQDIQYSQTQMQTETQKAVSKTMAEASIKSSKISASASITASKISASAQKYNTDANRLNVLGSLQLQGKINDAQIAEYAAKTAVLLQDAQIKAALHDERWAKLFSTMGAENVLASALAVKNGIPIEDILKGTEATPEMLRSIEMFSNDVLKNKSWVNIESESVTGIIKEGVGSARDTLGNFFGGN